MAYAARIVADSVNEAGDRLTTMEVTFPRFILAEFNTHRMFSRNSASSRAIPVRKQLARIMDDPFIPDYWGVNQPGMSASTELTGDERERANGEWLSARDDAVRHVEYLLGLNLHKQVANRLLEPFMWHTVIVTATEWSNYFALRTDKNAQPEIRVIAGMMRKVFEESQPQLLRRGEWHLPLVQDDEREWATANIEEAKKVSAGRCARVSYLTHDGRKDHSEDIRLCESLMSNGHMSPLEHVATPYVSGKYKHQRYGDGFNNDVVIKSAGWSGNFRGWQQFRKTVEHEHDFSLVLAANAT